MPKTVFQLKTTIVGTKPPVWRRVVVPAEIRLDRLHGVLQAAFGWWDYHFHEFDIDGVRYGVDDGWDADPPADERRARLSDVVSAGSTFAYVYDFGDDWRHKIVVEKALPAERGERYPACTGGRRACPPEDCGGVSGFERLLTAIADPEDAEHQSTLDWVGADFDPAAFDAAEFDQRLAIGRLIER
jgi:hypothetical protein